MPSLGSLGKLRSGFPLRGAVNPEPDGATQVVTLGDVTEDGIDWKRVARANQKRVTADDLLRAGDLIIRSRGASMATASITDLPALPTVAAAPLFVFTPTSHGLATDYLLWYLNRPDTLARLQAMAQGSSLPTISLADLAALDIPLPALEQQAHIVEIAALLREEARIAALLHEKHSQLLRAWADALPRVEIEQEPTR